MVSSYIVSRRLILARFPLSPGHFSFVSRSFFFRLSLVFRLAALVFRFPSARCIFANDFQFHLLF